MKIQWLDGESADGMFILEIMFKDGKIGYIKNKSLEVINNYKKIFKNYPEILEMNVNYPLSKAA